MQQKYAYLSKNMFLFTISRFAPKILTFLLVPLYTSTLSTAEYGIGDIILTTASLLLPILTLSIGEAVLRFCFDKNYTHQEVLSNTIYIFFKGFLLLLFFLIGIAQLQFFSEHTHYVVALGLIFFSHGLYDIISNFARGSDRITIMVEMSVVSTIATCGLNIALLLFFKLGIDGFLAAHYLGILITCGLGIVRLKLWQFVKFSYLHSAKRKELVKFSVPLIFNKISWWVNNAASRYIVTWLLGIAANGIYTVSYKIPTILTTCTGVFASAWQISAIKEFDKNDSDHFIINLYNLYNAFLVLCCSALILLNIPIAKFLYAKDFFEAWKYVPPLLISFVFGGLTGFFGSLFIAVKDTKILTTSSIAGGIVNIVLTYLLTSITHNAVGAAVATLVSNIVIWVIRAYIVRVYITLTIPYLRHGFMYILLFLQYIICLRGLVKPFVFAQIIIFILLIFVNYKEFISISGKIKKLIRAKVL